MLKLRKVVVCLALIFLAAGAYFYFLHKRSSKQRERVSAQAAKCNAFAPDYRTYVQTFRPGATTHPEFAMLQEKYKSLKHGLTETTVLSLLGKPTFTKTDSLPAGANHYACEWIYVLRATGDNVLDSISVRFGEDGLTKEWSRMDQYGRAVK